MCIMKARLVSWVKKKCSLMWIKKYIFALSEEGIKSEPGN